MNAKGRDDVSYHLEPAQFQSSRIKAVSLAEDIQNGGCYSFTENIYFSDYYSEDFPDISIIYNNKFKDEFSFSLNNKAEDKYDFVSVVLRDLFRGLGFNSNFKKNAKNNALEPLARYKTAFESHVIEALGDSTLEGLYEKATQGEVALYPDLKLYAPTEWQENISLNYFIPNDKLSLTKVLAYDFGRGTICRDLSKGYFFFEDLLDWIPRGLTVGSSGSEFTAAGSSEIKVPFNGVYETDEALPHQVLESDYENPAFRRTRALDQDTTIDFLAQFHVFKGTGHWEEGISICLLKNDGTWDLVYFVPGIMEPYVFSLKMPEWTLNCAPEEYARTADGYLRGRITLSRPILSRRGYNYTTTYFVVDYTPQKLELMEAKPAEGILRTKAAADAGTRRVRVQFKNIEGTTRVVIERKRQGHRVPSKFDVPDFKNGYFETDVETDKQTTFTAIAYNENGSTKSLPLVIQPLTTSTSSAFSFYFDGNTISISGAGTDGHEIAYEISPLIASGYGHSAQGYVADGCVDVSDLPKGLYVIKCTDEAGNTGSFKFKSAN